MLNEVLPLDDDGLEKLQNYIEEYAGESPRSRVKDLARNFRIRDHEGYTTLEDFAYDLAHSVDGSGETKELIEYLVRKNPSSRYRYYEFLSKYENEDIEETDETGSKIGEPTKSDVKKEPKQNIDQSTSISSNTVIELVSLIQNKLRKIIREKPTCEQDIQDSIESLLVGTEYESLFMRDKISIPYSSKHYFPDFASQKLDTVIEAKFCDSAKDEKGFISQINDDVLAYKTKFNNLIFVVYDLGFIRDIDQFKKIFETIPLVTVLVIKQ